MMRADRGGAVAPSAAPRRVLPRGHGTAAMCAVLVALYLAVAPCTQAQPRTQAQPPTPSSTRPAVVAADAPPPTAAFRAWVHAHAHVVRTVGSDADPVGDDELTPAALTGPLADLAPLRAVVGDARVLAVGEPFHGVHEPLVLRNRIVRYCVLALHCTAVALETGLAPSRALDAYVQGRVPDRSPAASDSALAAAFSYGFGRLRENLALLHWLHRYNAIRPAAERVRVYGIDLTGQVFPTATRALDAVFAYLDGADPALGRTERAHNGALSTQFRIDTFPDLSAAEQDRIAGQVVDLVARLRARRPSLVAATGADDYAWALQQAVNAEQDLAFLRRAPAGFWQHFRTRRLTPADSFGTMRPIREAAIAENVAWVLARERGRAGGRARVVLFAHDMHLQGHPFRGEGPVAGLLAGVAPAGMHLRAMLGPDLVVLATHVGQTEGFPVGASPLPPDVAGFDAMLTAPGVAGYLVDLRTLPVNGPLREWFAQEHALRGGDGGEAHEYVRPARAADALLYVARARRADLAPR